MYALIVLSKDWAGLAGTSFGMNQQKTSDRNRKAVSNYMSTRLKQIIPVDPEVERIWEEFWRDIVTDHGEPNLDLIKRELFDYHTALQEVPKVYDAITHGRFTKPNTTAQIILDCVEEIYGQGRDELSEIIESCHKMLDKVEEVEEEEEGTTSLTPLDERLRDYLSPGQVITDDMINGDD